MHGPVYLPNFRELCFLIIMDERKFFFTSIEQL
jgi:hypothetical protein